jgi:hypothetical protein
MHATGERRKHGTFNLSMAMHTISIVVGHGSIASSVHLCRRLCRGGDAGSEHRRAERLWQEQDFVLALLLSLVERPRLLLLLMIVVLQRRTSVSVIFNRRQVGIHKCAWRPIDRVPEGANPAVWILLQKLAQCQIALAPLVDRSWVQLLAVRGSDQGSSILPAASPTWCCVATASINRNSLGLLRISVVALFPDRNHLATPQHRILG